jgi:hypothetical protein
MKRDGKAKHAITQHPGLRGRFHPDSPTERWRAASTGTSRRRVVKGPGPAAQVQARVAAVKRDGTRSPWSDPILVQTR